MKSADLTRRLSGCIESAVRSHHFCASGVLAKVDPGIDVVGLGPVKLPLKPAAAKRLMAEESQPPADWARPADIACTCQHCRRLNEILAAPA